MKVKDVKKIFLVLYSFAIMTLIVNLLSLLFFDPELNGYKYTTDPRLNQAVLKNIADLISTNKIYCIIGCLLVLATLLINLFLKQTDNKKRKAVNRIILSVQYLANFGILFIAVLLMPSLPDFLVFRNQPSLLDYEFVVSVRDAFIAPIAAMLAIFCVNLFFGIISFIEFFIRPAPMDKETLVSSSVPNGFSS
ncbi:MAG: hypothetical protein FWF49_05415 [Oscillospiraceae bacterium]|nr:hypothetical protein [Oscillospiraceae bacterium]